jgi:CheY-like chemotaxis protein
MKMLVVDDEPDLRDLISELLETEGIDVVSAGGGNEAYRIFEAGVFDAIISDIRMPGGDGIELLEQVRARNKKIPVILITGFTDHSEGELRKKGASRVFHKPFEMDHFIAGLKRLVETGERS